MPTQFTTDLPAPSNLQVDYIDGSTYALSWDGSSNNGTYEILLSATGGDSFVIDGNSPEAPTTNSVTTEYDSSNTHVIKIRLNTGDVTKETATIEKVLAGSTVRTVDGVSDHELNGIIMTEKK